MLYRTSNNFAKTIEVIHSQDMRRERRRGESDRRNNNRRSLRDGGPQVEGSEVCGRIRERQIGEGFHPLLGVHYESRRARRILRDNIEAEVVQTS